jgi:hypothetical protein
VHGNGGMPFTEPLVTEMAVAGSLPKQAQAGSTCPYRALVSRRRRARCWP